MALIGNIEHFDATNNDFESYIERMEQFMIINSVEEKYKVSMFVTMMGPETYSILKNLLMPKEPCKQQYKVLVTTLKSHFSPKRLVIAERYKFNKRDQKDSETVGDYIVELKCLAKSCNFGGFLNDALRDRLVCGLRSSATQKKLLSEVELSFEEACETALNMELTYEQSKTFHAPIADGTIKKTSHQGQFKYNIKTREKNFSQTKSCFRCGRYHNPTTCPAVSWECFQCRKKGHTSKMCKNKAIRQVKEEVEGSMGTEHMELGYIGVIKSKEYPFVCNIKINNQNINMEVDTGACATVISEICYKKYFLYVPLEYEKSVLKTVTGSLIRSIGKVNVSVEINSKIYNLPIIVVKSKVDFKPLLGRNWLNKLWPEWHKNMFKVNLVDVNTTIKTVSESSNLEKERKYLVQTLKSKYIKVFDNNGTNSIKGFKADVKIKENCTPIFHKAYQVPYALLNKVESELSKLQKLGIIKPVKNSNWCSPIVVVPKKNNEIRICVDFKVTVNKVVEHEHYPLPNLSDIFASLAGNKIFTVVDLSGAYQQLEISDESKELFTINTHLGLFQYERLTYGISSAPMIFQSVMDRILQNISGVCCYLDDILIAGNSLPDCLEKVEVVFQRLSEYNVKINVEKCKFFYESVEYLGHIISSEGLRPTKEKVKGIINTKIPQNLTQLRSFLGMINFYNKFLPNLSTELRPLYELQEKGKEFIWSKECDTAFNQSKQLLIKNNLLAHYDPNKPIVVACDASPYGVGAVLCNIIEGAERPVFFASSSLSNAEKGYSQIEREALSIVFGVKKFHKYLYGQKFVLVTDHQPLKIIFNPKRGIPTLAAARLQRWAIILQAYNYDVVYRKGSENSVADFLSRFPMSEGTNDDPKKLFINSFNLEESFPITYKEIEKETNTDIVLVKVRDLILRGWPNYVEDVNFKPYFDKRFSLTIEQNCILWGIRVAIPSKLRNYVLDKLHDQHVGIVRMKQLARSLCWWPNIDSDIEKKASSCTACQVQNVKSHTEIKSTWPKSVNNFERVHIDFCEIEGKTLLIIFDTMSKWIDVHIMSKTNASNTIEKLKHTFAIYGLPNQLVSDNGPPFNSSEFNKFCQANGINVIKSPPYHPQSNGAAERSVQTIKFILKKQIYDMKKLNISLNMRQRLDNLLFKYRNTPCTVTGISPAEALFKQKPRTLLDLLKPSFGKNKNYETTTVEREENVKKLLFNVGDAVLVRSYNDNSVKWIPGRVLKFLSSNIYLVNVNNQVKLVHANQIKHSYLSQEQHPGMQLNIMPINVPLYTKKERNKEDEEQVVTKSENSEGTESESGENSDCDVRRSCRARKPPERLIYN